jgi:hypothetical protein
MPGASPSSRTREAECRVCQSRKPVTPREHCRETRSRPIGSPIQLSHRVGMPHACLRARAPRARKSRLPRRRKSRVEGPRSQCRQAVGGNRKTRETRGERENAETRETAREDRNRHAGRLRSVQRHENAVGASPVSSWVPERDSGHIRGNARGRPAGASGGGGGASKWANQAGRQSRQSRQSRRTTAVRQVGRVGAELSGAQQGNGRIGGARDVWTRTPRHAKCLHHYFMSAWQRRETVRES